MLNPFHLVGLLPVTDFRNVNAVTKPDSFSLLTLKDCVDQVGAAKYAGMFNHLRVNDRFPFLKEPEKTTFVTPSVLYSYTVCLMGCEISQPHLMNKVWVGGLCVLFG